MHLPENFEEFQNLPLDQIQPGEEQPRDVFDFEKMQELSQSIKANGILQPIVVYRDPASKGRYRIIAGERRWRAAGMAGLKEIPALVRSVEREKLLELSLIENIQREDLNPIEVATAFERLQSEHGLRPRANRGANRQGPLNDYEFSSPSQIGPPCAGGTEDRQNQRWSCPGIAQRHR